MIPGQNYHMVGSIGQLPKYCQLYVYDMENEVENMKIIVPSSDTTDPDIVNGLLLMLNENNLLVHGFLTARERFKDNENPKNVH